MALKSRGTMIKVKTGHCFKCPPDAKDVPLIAKMCKSHYWESRRKVNAEKPGNKKKKQVKAVVGAFFASQTLLKPKCCEECEAVLPVSPAWMVRACIAHILPKRDCHGFPSVAIHPMNKMFLCLDCHTNFDNLGDVFILKMKLLPVIRERVLILLPLLTTGERNRVPEYLLQDEMESNLVAGGQTS